MPLAALSNSTTPDFPTRLREVATLVESRLDQLLPQPTGHQSVIYDAARYAALGGGKRLRPFLVVETARMLGGDIEAALTVGCALECLHVYSLVHDDLPCMDDDDLRRGKPTVHKAYDEAIAVLAGDALLTRSFGILGELDIDPLIRATLVTELAISGGMSGMIGGQVVDITVAEGERDEALITELQAMKTGALIDFAVRAGGYVSGASAEQLAALSGYATDMGLAFQIQDDILDVTGDAETVGKAVGKDANLGKATFVSILGLEGARKRAQDLGERAMNHLEPWGKDAQTLRETVDFVLERQH
ncbi:polyprenyl synthetase family protein [Litorimonas sp. WD9-15]|uniref:polyprenyl synthetase family protein n=1 Tax=Litorimonas sp. WD9-15 TaxID=3418716 RepID=UPI003CFE970B